MVDQRLEQHVVKSDTGEVKYGSVAVQYVQWEERKRYVAHQNSTIPFLSLEQTLWIPVFWHRPSRNCLKTEWVSCIVRTRCYGPHFKLH